MSFSETVKDAALKRSGGRCECRRVRHKWHTGKQRCKKTVTPRTAQFHHVTAQSAPSSHDGLSNCEVLCRECHEGTASYGRS